MLIHFLAWSLSQIAMISEREKQSTGSVLLKKNRSKKFLKNPEKTQEFTLSDPLF